MSNPKSKNLIVLIVTVIVIAVAGYAVAKYSPDFKPAGTVAETAGTTATTTPEGDTPESVAADEEPEGEAEADQALHGEGAQAATTDEGEAADTQATPATGAQSTPAPVKPGDVTVVVTAAGPADPRVIGKADAPVTMTEFSSLTCPHCAAAHEEILPVLIKEYVETGKLKIVLSDFPLNKQALDASKISRCVANDQYWGFVSLLFSNIGAWAEGANFPEALLQNAQLTGLSKERAQECLNSMEIETALLLKVQEAGQRFKISSTPTFVFNDGATTIKGTQDIGVFRKAIDDLLAQQ